MEKNIVKTSTKISSKSYSKNADSMIDVNLKSRGNIYGKGATMRGVGRDSAYSQWHFGNKLLITVAVVRVCPITGEITVISDEKLEINSSEALSASNSNNNSSRSNSFQPVDRRGASNYSEYSVEVSISTDDVVLLRAMDGSTSVANMVSAVGDVFNKLIHPRVVVYI